LLLGWVASPFSGASAIVIISLQFGRWFAWLLAFLVFGYTVAGVIRRAIDSRKFDATDDPTGLTWSQFESLIAEFYRRQGSTVTARGGPSSDGGVDLTLTDLRGDRLIVQCKHWKSRLVGVKPLRELWGVMSDEKADGAIFVTSGSFSADAAAFAQGKRLELIDGPQLSIMIAHVKGRTAAPSPTSPEHLISVPRCPRCDSPMVLRTAKRGVHSGEQFWGCSTYPKCEGTRPK
jgi:restriction system protein